MTIVDINYLKTASLKPWAKNARTHSKKQIKQLANSMQEFGFTNPVLIDDDANILAGHGRVKAAELLGLDEVPCVLLSSMSEEQKRAYVIADNKLALNAGWDEELLAQELKALTEADISFDTELTGFSIAEIDQLIEDQSPQEPGNPEDDVLFDAVPVPRRCNPGDIWALGEHRLICGNALDPEIISLLMDGQKAAMVFSDPPYNVPIDGHVGGLGKTKHREFGMASGEMSRSQFTRFLESAFKNMADHSKDGAIHFQCMDWRHVQEMMEAGHSVYSELKNMIVWVKDNGGMGTFYRSRHELVFAWKVGTASHTNTFELGQHGRYRTNVWQYKGVNTLKSGRMEELSLHPTVKPVQMITDAIKDVSGRGEIVLDVFGGSGSTLIAAHKSARRGFLCELDPIYCDRILHRWEVRAKDEAKQLACGIEQGARLLEAAQ